MPSDCSMKCPKGLVMGEHCDVAGFVPKRGSSVACVYKGQKNTGFQALGKRTCKVR